MFNFFLVVFPYFEFGGQHVFVSSASVFFFN